MFIGTKNLINPFLKYEKNQNCEYLQGLKT